MPVVLFHSPSIAFASRTPVSIGVIPKHTTYGFAVMPVGFQFDFARQKRLHPIAEINGGVVASTDPVPFPLTNATGLNFLFNFGGGLRWHHKPGQAITAGYRFLHVSNAGTSAYNPGLDNNILYISYSFLR
jgi:hypothetical protein